MFPLTIFDGTHPNRASASAKDIIYDDYIAIVRELAATQNYLLNLSSDDDFTPGSVIFAGQDGGLSEGNITFINNSFRIQGNSPQSGDILELFSGEIFTGKFISCFSGELDEEVFHVSRDGDIISRSNISIFASNDINASQFLFRKSRAGGAVTSGDRLGTIDFEGHDGTELIHSAQMRVVCEGTIGTGRVPGSFIVAVMTDSVTPVLTDRIKIDSQGRLGVNNIGVLTAQGHIVGDLTTEPALLVVGAPNHSVAVLRVKAAGLPSGHLLEVDSAGGSDGDLFHVAVNGNTFVHDLLIGETSVGTDGIHVLSHQTGVAPTTSPDDGYQQYSADHVAGNACPHWRTENDSIIKLFQTANIPDPSGGTVIDIAARDAINLILDWMEAGGHMAGP